MNANQSATMYESIPVVSELNKVQGFDPLKFMRRTSKGEKVLDLKYKKLWFRLKYPNGRIKLFPLKITEKLAIIEARVYFDKNDTQPKSSFIAQRDANTTPGGLYIESAQHAAIDQALADAGFGVQFTAEDPNKTVKTTLQVLATDTVTEKPVETTPVIQKESVVTVVEEIATPVEETQTAQAVVSETVVGETPVQEQPETVIEVPTAEVEAEPIAEVIETAEETEGEEVEEDTPVGSVDAPSYTADMPVDEICSMMTYEEAGNVIVPLGTCKDWNMQQVAERRPASLKWYINGYSGDNNILRAAAKIMQSAIDGMQKAS